MSGSSVSGISSGLDTESIIKALMAVKHQKIDKLQASKDKTTNEINAWSKVSSNLLTLNLSVYNLSRTATWDVKTTTSSDDTLLTAIATSSATKGNYAVSVKALATKQQLLSNGYMDADTTYVGAGTITLESAQAKINPNTNLSWLNSETGFVRGSLKITDRNGDIATIDLSGANSLQDVLNTINYNGTAKVTASLNADGNGLVITDTTLTGSNNLIINEIGSGYVAHSLGIYTGAGGVAGDKIGDNINKASLTTNLANLNDGLGVYKGSFTLTQGANVATVNLSTANSLNDVITTINASTATGTPSAVNVTAALSSDGRSITLTTTGGAFSVQSNDTSKDLGIEALTTTGDGQKFVADLDSVLLKNLNGGLGIDTVNGFVINGALSKTIDISTADSMSDVLAAINAETASTGVIATVTADSKGILLSRSGGTFTVAENGAGTTAANLGILQATSVTQKTGTNVERQYLDYQTKLSTLNLGQGVSQSKVQFTDRTGATAQVDMSLSTTITNVIDAINAAGLNITASINSSGNGLLLTDTTAAPLITTSMQVAEVGSGTAAKDLGILGTASTATLNGKLQQTITLGATDTLTTMRDKINALSGNFSSTIYNDGTTNPYRLSINSTVEGKQGELLITTSLSGGAGLSLATTQQALDAALVVGDMGSRNSIYAYKSSNKVSDLITGLTLNLTGTTGTTPTTITVSEDYTSLTEAAQDFVDKYNTTMKYISQQMAYNGSTGETGILFTDQTLMRLQQELFNGVNSSVNGAASDMSMLSQAGMSLGLDGTLSLSKSAFQEVLSTKLDKVKDLFTIIGSIETTSLGASTTTNAAVHNGTSRAQDDNTSSTDFESGTTGWQATSQDSLYYELNLGSVQQVNQINMFTIDSANMSATNYGIKSYDLEYLNTITSQWTLLCSVSNNTKGTVNNYLVDPIYTSKIRMNNITTNATDNQIRLVELQILQDKGLAKKLNHALDSLTNVSTGGIDLQVQGLENTSTLYDDSIAHYEDIMTKEEAQLRAKFTALETAMGQMKNQSSWLTQQMTGVQNNWG